MGCCSSVAPTAQNKNEVVEEDSTLIETLAIEKQPKRRLTQNVIVENQNRDIKDYYDLDRKMVLGSGISGQVKIGIHKATSIQYAIKSLSKHNLRVDKLLRLKDEIKCMAQLDHPNILKLHEYFETDQVIYLVLELCTGGELLDRLHEQQGHHYSEKVACRYVQTMLSAITYCHTHNIVHRDLKLENFLFEDESPNAELKLIDFGLSHYTKPQEILHRAVGTPYYVAPEVLQGNYDAKCDVWSIGVIAYMLLSGTPPFYGKNDAETLASVKLGRWSFDEYLFRPISAAAKDFISKCLTRRPHARPTALEALNHKWFRILEPDGAQSGKEPNISLDVIARLHRYVKRSQLSKIIMDVVAHTLLPEQIGDLKQEFLKFDISKTGEITIKDLKNALQNYSGFQEEEVEKMFQEMDIDQTGMVSYHEFIAATISRQRITESNLKLAFEKMSNHNDVIHTEDIRGLLGNSQYDLKQIMEEVGLAEDSEISFDQFKSIMYGGYAHSTTTSPLKSNMRKMAFFKDGEFSPRTVPNYYDSPMPDDRSNYRLRKSFSSAEGVKTSQSLPENERVDFSDPSQKDHDDDNTHSQSHLKDSTSLPTVDETSTTAAFVDDSIQRSNKFASPNDLWTS